MSIWKHGRALVWLVMLGCAAGGTIRAENRIALVMGNGSYPATQNLQNAPRDAVAVAEALKLRQFTVINSQVEDLDHDGMAKCLELLGDYKETPLDLVVFYFAGHSVEHAGELFLLPAKARITSAEDFEDKAFPLRRCIERVRALKGRRFLFLVDGCRNSPSYNGASQQKSTSYPLSDRVCIALATGQGKYSHDFGKVAVHGPFAAALLDGLKTPGATVDNLLNHVRRTVAARTGNQQVPTVFRADGEWDQVVLTPNGFREPLLQTPSVVLKHPVYLHDGEGKPCGILLPKAQAIPQAVQVVQNGKDPAWYNVTLTGWMVQKNQRSRKTFLEDLNNGSWRVLKQIPAGAWSANTLKLRSERSLKDDAPFATLKEGALLMNSSGMSEDGREWRFGQWTGFTIPDIAVSDEDLKTSGLVPGPAGPLAVDLSPSR